MYKKILKKIIIFILLIISILHFGETIINQKNINGILSFLFTKILNQNSNFIFTISQIKIDTKNFKIYIPEIRTNCKKTGNFLAIAENIMFDVDYYKILKRQIGLKKITIDQIKVTDDWSVDEIKKNFLKSKNFLNLIEITNLLIKNCLVNNKENLSHFAIKTENFRFNIKNKKLSFYLELGNLKTASSGEINSFFTSQVSFKEGNLDFSRLNFHNNNILIRDSHISTNFQKLTTQIKYEKFITDKMLSYLVQYFDLSKDFQNSKKIVGTIKSETFIEKNWNTNFLISCENLSENTIYTGFDIYFIKNSPKIWRIENFKSNIINILEKSFIEYDFNDIKKLKTNIVIQDQEISQLKLKHISGKFNLSISQDNRIDNFVSNIDVQNLKCNNMKNTSFIEKLISEISKFEITSKILDLPSSTLKKQNFIFIEKLNFSINKLENTTANLNLYNIEIPHSPKIPELNFQTKLNKENIQLQISSQDKEIFQANTHFNFEKEFFNLKKIQGNLQNTKFHLVHPVQINIQKKIILQNFKILFKEGEIMITQNPINNIENIYQILIKKNNVKYDKYQVNLSAKHVLKIDFKNLFFSFLQEIDIKNSDIMQNQFSLKTKNYLSNNIVESHIFFENENISNTKINLRIPINLDIKNLEFFIKKQEEKFLIELNSNQITLSKLLVLLPDLKKLDAIFKGFFQIKGSIQNHIIKCDAQINEIQYKSSLNDIYLYRASFNAKDDGNNKIILNNVILRSSDKSSFTGYGDIVFSPNIKYQIHFNTKFFSVLGQEFYGPIKGQIILLGNLDNATASGKIYSLNSVLNLNNKKISDNKIESFNIQNFHIKQDKILATKNKLKKYELFLDLITISDKSLTIKMSDIICVASGRVDILGSLSTTIFSGRLESKNGYYTTLGKKFDIHSAKIILHKNILHSYIDMFCSTTIDPYNIYMHVTGKISFPKLSLTSTPYLKEQEIISLLAFGNINHNTKLDNILLSANLGSLIKNLNFEEQNMLWTFLKELTVSLHMSFIKKVFLPFSLSFPIRRNLLLEYTNFNKIDLHNSLENNISLRYFYEF
ncbi:MAG: translocation/assembly module TamB domain-containing protein [Rickettsia sp.]|nr:translocation/assembly module TamB domain-containing protein [Rickettsia sp.]